MLEKRRETLESGHLHIAHSCCSLGKRLSRIGESEEAEVLLREALRIQQAEFGNTKSPVGWTKHELARALFTQERLDEAEALWLDAYRILKECHPNKDFDNIRKWLVKLYQHTGRPQDAGDWK